MVTMEHPNGCVHNVADELVEKFTKAGWKVKAVQTEPPTSKPKPKPKTKSPKQ